MTFVIEKKMISSIVVTIIQEKFGPWEMDDNAKRASERFLHNQINSLPFFFRIPIKILIIYLSCSTITKGGLFHNLNQEQKFRILNQWRLSRLGFKSEFIRFFDSLVIFCFASYKVECL